MTDQADIKKRFKSILKQKSNYWIAAAVLVLIVIYYGSLTEQDKMLSAQADHDHEKALMIADKLLKKNSNNTTAKAVIKKSGQLFNYLQQAKLTLNQFRAVADDLSGNPEKLSEGLQKARAYTAKAKSLDPKAERLLAFETTLDEAEHQLAYFLAMNAMSSGQSVISEAANKYQKTTEIVEAANSSAYLAQFLTFQSSGASIGKPVAEIKASIEPHLKQMQKTSQLVFNTASKDESLTKNLTAYNDAVKSTVDTMLAPQGTFKDFATIAEKSMTEYKKSLAKLKRDFSEDNASEESIAGIVENLVTYKIFHDHEIYKIMSSNKSMFES